MMHEFWWEFWLLGLSSIVAWTAGAYMLGYKAHVLRSDLAGLGYTWESATNVAEWVYSPFGVLMGLLS